MTKFISAVNRADSYMKLKFFYKDYFRRNKGFTDILIKTRGPEGPEALTWSP